MRRLICVVPAAAALFVVLLGTSASAAPQQATLLSVDPSAVSVATDSASFNISVSVDDAQGAAAYEFGLTYDPNIVEFLGVADAGFLSSTGRVTDCAPANDFVFGNTGLNVVSFGCGTRGLIENGAGTLGPSGPGALATLSFRPKTAGSTRLDFVGLNGGADADLSHRTFTSLDGVETCTASGCAIPYIPLTVAGALVTVGDPADRDGDGIPNEADNCPDVANPDQTNTDALPHFGDVTVPNADGLGDACDPDIDNDGIPNADEAAGCNASGPLDPLLADTDGDRVLDGAECALGSNPTDPLSTPAYAPALDSDGDGLPDTLEIAIGSDPRRADTDADGVPDGVEFRGYNTSPTNQDTDGDGCSDGHEIASLDDNLVVDSNDLVIVARAYGSRTDVRADVNRDGIVNVLDLLLVARLFGTCEPAVD